MKVAVYMKLGRPRALIKRDVQINLKFTSVEAQKIFNCARKFNLSRTDTILKAIDLLISSKPKIYRSQVQDKIDKKHKKILPTIDSDDED